MCIYIYIHTYIRIYIYQQLWGEVTVTADDPRSDCKEALVSGSRFGVSSALHELINESMNE